MIKVNQKELFSILKESLRKDYKITATNFKVCLEWENMSHDRPNKVYYFDGTKGHLPFVSYYDGYSYKNLTVGEIKMYLGARYPDHDFISFVYRIKDNKKFLENEMKDDEWRKLAEFCVEIHYDDEAELDKEDVREMIELALKLNDKQWFQELVARFRDMKDHKENA